MNRFMYLTKRKFSNDIKSLYPKCINCINFKSENQTCKKFIMTGNYIDNDSKNQLAITARFDNTKCGEEGKLFDIGKEELEKRNETLFKTTCFWFGSTGILYFVTNEVIIIFPVAIIVGMSLISFGYDSMIYEEKIENEKKRLEDYNKLLNKSKE